MVIISDNTFTKEEIITTERNILKKLEYNITVTTVYQFLQTYSSLCSLAAQAYNFSSYLSEITLLSPKFLQFAPSIIAGACVFLSHRILKIGVNWKLEGYVTENDLKLCSREIITSFHSMRRSHLKSLYKKYLHPKYAEVAKLDIRISC